MPNSGKEHIGVDPGSEESGWVRFVLSEKSPSGIKIKSFGKTKNVELRRMLKAWPKETRGVLAVETPKAQGMSVANEVFETCIEIGRTLQVWGGSSWTYCFRGDIKLCVCGASTAKDPNVRAALIDEFGGEKRAIGGKKCDVCHGKGWTGREHKPCQACLEHPGWKYVPGPLCGLAKDMWAALAVAVYWARQRPKRHRLNASNQGKAKQAKPSDARKEAVKEMRRTRPQPKRWQKKTSAQR